ncbi:hypothetical protein [Piscinibacter sakaiensis]|uniref:hypothetical protein n=1 Tax=Piscinibacter sakaiensis TaxID=1547922 RepID=UPI003AB04773
MQTVRTIQLPERMRVLVTLAGLLERLEVDVRSGGAHQYQSVVRHLIDELGRFDGDETLELVLGNFPATAELYENLRYGHAGLCRAPLELSLNSELQSREAIARAAGKSTD